MSLADDYKKQFAWRDWQTALSRCPITPGQQILDLGCAVGDLSRELSRRGVRVTGIDSNAELLAVAKQSASENCRFLCQDIRSLDVEEKSYDGLWCSFTAAYLPTLFPDVIESWKRFLKKRAWICVVEIDDLFGHEPLSPELRARVLAFYDEALAAGRYDFRMGRKIESALRKAGFRAESFTLKDRELAFDGAASEEVLQAWSNRLDRMATLRNFLAGKYDDFRVQFLASLVSGAHRSLCRVVCAVGVQGG